jgi:hypothetical protein
LTLTAIGTGVAVGVVTGLGVAEDDGVGAGYRAPLQAARIKARGNIKRARFCFRNEEGIEQDYTNL